MEQIPTSLEIRNDAYYAQLIARDEWLNAPQREVIFPSQSAQVVTARLRDSLPPL